MITMMYAASGVGLAAPQVGVSERLIVVDPSGGDSMVALVQMVNPEVIWTSADVSVAGEGCLSLPGVDLQIIRHVACDVRYGDLCGSTRVQRCVGLLARIVQHEVDHLDGITLLDRVGTLSRKFALGDLSKANNRKKHT